MPSPPIAKERCDLPSTKRQKVEEETACDDSYDSEDEEFELFNEELKKGGGFEIDFSKFRYFFNWQPLDLDDSTMVDEPQTNRDLMAMLSKHALTKHNAEYGTNLELGEILRANFHPSAGVTYYISFEVNDPTDGDQTKPYRAVVRYLTGDIDETTFDDSDSDNSEDGTPEEIQLFYDECDKSQDLITWQPLDLDDSTMVEEPQTNRDFLAMLSNQALTKQNAENGTRLEMGKILRANFHPSAGITFYISFEVNDPSDDANEAKPYRAVVRSLAGDVEVHSCKPKPSL